MVAHPRLHCDGLGLCSYESGGVQGENDMQFSPGAGDKPVQQRALRVLHSRGAVRLWRLMDAIWRVRGDRRPWRGNDWIEIQEAHWNFEEAIAADNERRRV